MTYRLILTLTLASLLLVGGNTLAMCGKCNHGKAAESGHGHHGSAGHHGPAGGIAVFLADLDLSEAQQNDITTIVDAEMANIASLREQAIAVHEKMDAAMAENPVDEEKVRQLAREHADRKTTVKLAKLEMQNKIRAVLTPEQQEKFAEMKATRNSHHGKCGKMPHCAICGMHGQKE